MPKVSLIITTHNRVELLERAIESAFTAGSDLEVIVVDDASTDGTQEYCRGRDDINYVRLDENLRTAGARNAGIEVASAPYIAFLDDDDFRLPGSIDRQVGVLDSNVECGLIYGRYFESDGDRNYDETQAVPAKCPEGDVLEELLKMNFIGLSTCVVRKSVLEGVGMFDPTPLMYGIEDWDLWLRVAERNRVCALLEPVVVYRIPLRGTGQWSSDIHKQFGRVARAYKTKWFHLPRVDDMLTEGTVTKSRLLSTVADRILYDMSTNSTGTRERVIKTMAALRCQPLQLFRLSFYKTILRSFVG